MIITHYYITITYTFPIVYATTAANPNESSYACYFDNKLETYLGDVYSVKWMENVDQVKREGGRERGREFAGRRE